MHELVRAASHALSAQDAEELERLVPEVRNRAERLLHANLGELSRAVAVLEQQVRAAELHLGISTRLRDYSASGKRNPWVL